MPSLTISDLQQMLYGQSVKVQLVQYHTLTSQNIIKRNIENVQSVIVLTNVIDRPSVNKHRISPIVHETKCH